MFQILPLPAAQEVRDGSSGMTLCIVMKNDGVLYHQVSSFSPECWAKVVLQKRSVVGSFTVCFGGTVWWSRIPSMSYATMNIAHTAHCIGYTFFARGEPGCFHSFDWRFKFGLYERAHVLSVVLIRPRKSLPSLWYRSNQACATA